MKAGPDQELINRAFRIKPVVRASGGELHFIQPIDLYEMMYTMEGPMSAGRVDEDKLEKIGEFEYRIPAAIWNGTALGPRIADVLPQIPQEYLGRASAYIAHPSNEEADNGCVMARCELYSGELPEDIRQQPVVAWKRSYAAPFPEPPAPKETFNATAATTLDQNITPMKPLELKKLPSAKIP